MTTHSFMEVSAMGGVSGMDKKDPNVARALQQVAQHWDAETQKKKQEANPFFKTRDWKLYHYHGPEVWGGRMGAHLEERVAECVPNMENAEADLSEIDGDFLDGLPAWKRALIEEALHNEN